MTDDSDYKEFQFATFLMGVAVAIQIFIAYSYLNHLGNHPIGFNGFALNNILFLLIYLLFYGMKTQVNHDRILISYGIGIIRTRIFLDNVKSVEVVENHWYYGLGIRLIPHGVLYNINGLASVELKLKDQRDVIRIGTKNPGQLRDEIRNRLMK